jgi:oligopeptide/dipeptide ABC transporter ATP-binding protein
VIGLEKPTEGSVHFDGIDLKSLKAEQLRRLRRRMQVIFQDPMASLNPRMTLGTSISHGLKIHYPEQAPEHREMTMRIMERVGLVPPNYFYNKFPHQISGGQRQRVVIASAMVLQPELLLADEPVSMLDVSIRAEILNLLRDLRHRRGVSIVFITHDLSTVAYFADRIAVMYLGRMVETGPAREVLSNPQHPYTKALISVIPVPNPRLRRERIILQGETPNPINLPSGCRFHPRCPVAIEACKTIDPDYVQMGENHQAACLLLEST